ncbi:hypothetical protein ACLB2K_052588 [Fragaria x ananassa]
MVIRDTSGNPIISACKAIGEVGVLVVEVVALREGLHTVVINNFKHVIVEGDSKLLIDCLHRKIGVPWTIQLLPIYTSLSVPKSTLLTKDPCFEFRTPIHVGGLISLPICAALLRSAPIVVVVVVGWNSAVIEAMTAEVDVRRDACESEVSKCEEGNVNVGVIGNGISKDDGDGSYVFVTGSDAVASDESDPTNGHCGRVETNGGGGLQLQVEVVPL